MLFSDFRDHRIGLSDCELFRHEKANDCAAVSLEETVGIDRYIEI